MKVKLPIIGLVKTGSDAQPEPVITRTKIRRAEKSIEAVLGGVLSGNTRQLSSEKSVSSKLLEANKEWVYRNNDVIAKEVANIDFKLYKILNKSKDIEYEEVDDHPLLDLLDRFNASTTKSDAIYTTQSHKKLTGDAFWYLEGSGSDISNIFILPPDKVHLVIGDPTDSSDELIEAYEYKDKVDNNTVERRYEPDEIIHFKTPNPKNPFRGYGAVEAAAETIDLDNLTAFTTRKFFENGAIINFLLSTEQKLTPEQLRRLKAEFQSAYGGVNKAFQAMILGGGLKAEKIQFSNKEMEFLAQLEWYRDKIMVMFGNTKASLGIIDDVNRASHESSIISWKRNSVKPDMQAIVNTLNEFLVPKYGEDLVLGFKDPIPEDRQAKITEVYQLLEQDVISPNEARELLGYDTRPNPVNDELRRENPAVPAPLQQIDLEKVLRARGFYSKRDVRIALKEAAIPLAKKIIKSKKKSNKRKLDLAYWEKQIKVVEVIEQKFENAVKQFIKTLHDIAIDRVDEEVAESKGFKKKALYDKDDLETRAELDFTPILMEQVLLAGNIAYQKIGLDTPYLPRDIRKQIIKRVRLFAGSMVETDQAKLATIISAGIKDGKSVADIRREITTAFDTITKTQSERVTRTEVLRASNLAAQDAFEQSGVVEGKEWLTAGDPCPECEPYDGKTTSLKGSFYSAENELEDGDPPLHPSCRCVILPIVEK